MNFLGFSMAQSEIVKQFMVDKTNFGVFQNVCLKNSSLAFDETSDSAYGQI